MTPDPMLPAPYRVTARTAETHDSATLCLEPVDAALPPFAPGQFAMLYATGVGEVAISISDVAPGDDPVLTHTIRDVGAVSRALHDAGEGSVVGVRGPFGLGWDVSTAAGQDIVIVAGGVGLAPLRPVVREVLAHRSDYGLVVLIAGARRPSEFLYRDELAEWAARPDIDVELCIDTPAAGWDGHIGFVTESLRRMLLAPERTVAFLCGPEPMMRFSADLLLRRGLPADRIRVSLERNMKCGVALCGHCQLGPLLICRDGPVVTWQQAAPLLAVREL